MKRMTKNCSFIIVWNTKNFRRLKRMWTRSQMTKKKSWLFLARKFKFFDTLVVIVENIFKKEMNDFGSITACVIWVWWRKNSYWRLPGRFCTKSSLSMRWCGKQEAKRPCQRTTPHRRTSFEWRGSSQRWWARYVKIFSKATQPQGNFAKDPSTLFLPFRLKPNYVNYSTFSGFWNSDFSCFCSIWPRVSFLMV